MRQKILSCPCVSLAAATAASLVPAAAQSRSAGGITAASAAAAVAAPPGEKAVKDSKSQPKTQEPAPTTVPAPPAAKPRYRAVLRLLDDTCPFNDFRESRYLEIDPFGYGFGFVVPLQEFGSIFTAPVTLQGPSTLASTGGGISYSGQVSVNVTMMPGQVPAEFTGAVASDTSQFNARFRVNGYCSISGSIEGQRL